MKRIASEEYVWSITYYIEEERGTLCTISQNDSVCEQAKQQYQSS